MTRTGGAADRPALGRTELPPSGRAGRVCASQCRVVLRQDGNRRLSLIVVAGLTYVRLIQPGSAQFSCFHICKLALPMNSPVQASASKASSAADDNGLLQFELGNVRITDASGEPLIMAPTAAVSLSRRAMVRGQIAIESLDCCRPASRCSIPKRERSPQVLFSAQGAAATRLRCAGPWIRRSRPRVHRRMATGARPHRSCQSDLRGFRAARRREHASAYLREIGLRSATVVVDNGARKSIWRVPEFDLDLDHRRSRSSFSPAVPEIESLAGPWELNFRASEHVNTKALDLTVSAQGLVPRGLARTFPQLVGLEGLDVPLWAEALSGV